MEFFGCSGGISWTICKQSAPRSRQIITPTPHHSIFTGRMLFLAPNQQCQSTERNKPQMTDMLYYSGHLYSASSNGPQMRFVLHVVHDRPTEDGEVVI